MNKEVSTELATQPDSPMRMLQAAIDNKLDPAIIEKMLDLRDRWEASEARKAYMEAVAAFKADPPKVYKDRLNKQYNSKYSSLANLVNTVNAALSKHGLNARWDIAQAEAITVSCILSHVMGHSERVSMSGPADESGSKNKLQQIKSTVTYLKIATFEAVTGVASEDMDDDGNAADRLPRITEEQAANLQALIDEVKANKNAFLKYFKADSLEDIAAQAYSEAVKMLEAKRK
jgi:hypothetical protein